MHLEAAQSKRNDAFSQQGFTAAICSLQSIHHGSPKKAVVERNCEAIQTEVKSNKKEKGPLQWCATNKFIALTAVSDSL